MQDINPSAKRVSFLGRFRDVPTIVSIVVLVVVWAILQ